MEALTEKKIELFLRSLDIDNLDILDYVDIENIDLSDPFNSIFNMVNDNLGFIVEIIYYYNAIEYLKNNDPSLRDSLLIASDMGFNISDISSEDLASLHATQKLHEDFYSKQTKIENFFNLL